MSTATEEVRALQETLRLQVILCFVFFVRIVFGFCLVRWPFLFLTFSVSKYFIIFLVLNFSTAVKSWFVQVQERKLLLKKIRSLKEQLGGGQEVREEEEEGERMKRRRLVEEEEEELRRKRVGGEVREELGIQCDLGDTEAMVEAYSGSCTK